ncbi:MAG: hypothetical protein HOO96_01220 [Polyangiaceae bacterium]|nr:hypothetical protein [Polyangiaceae bacterium]
MLTLQPTRFAFYTTTLVAAFSTSLGACSQDDGVAAAGGDVAVQFEQPPDTSKKSYRLVGAFGQVDDDFAPPPVDVAFDIPFDPASQAITLPSMRAPSEANLLCMRAAQAPDKVPGPCAEASPYKVGIAVLVVAEDVDRDGKVSMSSKGVTAPDVLFAVAQGAIVFDAKDGSVMPPRKDGPLFVDGALGRGFILYESYRPAGSSFDRLRARTGPLKFGPKPINLL